MVRIIFTEDDQPEDRFQDFMEFGKAVFERFRPFMEARPRRIKQT